MKKLFKREEGQALVEMALVLPILLAVVCGIIDFGWLFYNQLSLQNGCREGARKACIVAYEGTRDQDVHDKIVENIPGNLEDSLDVNITLDETDKKNGPYITVEVSADVRVLTPVAGVFFSGQVMHLNSEVTMKVEAEKN